MTVETFTLLLFFRQICLPLDHQVIPYMPLGIAIPGLTANEVIFESIASLFPKEATWISKLAIWVLAPAVDDWGFAELWGRLTAFIDSLDNFAEQKFTNQDPGTVV